MPFISHPVGVINRESQYGDFYKSPRRGGTFNNTVQTEDAVPFISHPVGVIDNIESQYGDFYKSPRRGGTFNNMVQAEDAVPFISHPFGVINIESPNGNFYKSPRRGETFNNTVQAEGAVPWHTAIRELRPKGTRHVYKICRTHYWRHLLIASQRQTLKYPAPTVELIGNADAAPRRVALSKEIA